MALPTAPMATASFHTQRLLARRAALRRVFSLSAMERAWSNYVRPGLRDQEVLDLHDFNDVHWGRNTVFRDLRAAILAGRYTPGQSVPVRVEKKHGVTRTVVMPSAEDAVVLQCIVEHIIPIALPRQPSENAFFSRSHGFSTPQMRFFRDYIWFVRWKKFSTVRMRLSSAHKFVCTTDIANYFDNIDYTHLRNILSTLDGVHEVILDIPFFSIRQN